MFCPTTAERAVSSLDPVQVGSVVSVSNLELVESTGCFPLGTSRDFQFLSKFGFELEILHILDNICPYQKR